jgi:hypothetical protein
MADNKPKRTTGSYFGTARGSKGGYYRQMDEIDKTHEEQRRASQTPEQNSADEVFESVENDDRPDWEKLLDEINQGK